jgi:hypothetical protein
MTTTLLSRPATRVDRVAYAIAVLLLASGLLTGAYLLLTGGSWVGPVSLRKAASFGVSFGLTLATVTWATSFVSTPRRPLLLGLFTAASVMETVLVSLQAWRGVPSHFNFETGFDSAVSMTLAAGGAILIATAIGFTAGVLRGAVSVAPSLRLALRYGMFSLLVALGAGAAMIAGGVRTSRSGDPELAYHTAGYLKPLHGAAMHAILVVPAFAWALRLTSWSEPRRVRAVWWAIVAYSAVIAGSLMLSLAGR